jgi:hypothetical protein
VNKTIEYKQHEVEERERAQFKKHPKDFTKQTQRQSKITYDKMGESQHENHPPKIKKQPNTKQHNLDFTYPP